MITLTPKQNHSPNCFEAVLEVASENPDATVFNGWVYNGRQWILHAWCEIGDDVVDLTESHDPMDKTIYYQVMGITPERSVRYSRLAFFELVAEHGHFGPFDTRLFFATKSLKDPLTEIHGADL